MTICIRNTGFHLSSLIWMLWYPYWRFPWRRFWFPRITVILAYYLFSFFMCSGEKSFLCFWESLLWMSSFVISWSYFLCFPLDLSGFTGGKRTPVCMKRKQKIREGNELPGTSFICFIRDIFCYSGDFKVLCSISAEDSVGMRKQRENGLADMMVGCNLVI